MASREAASLPTAAPSPPGNSSSSFPSPFPPPSPSSPSSSVFKRAFCWLCSSAAASPPYSSTSSSSASSSSAAAAGGRAAAATAQRRRTCVKQHARGELGTDGECSEYTSDREAVACPVATVGGISSSQNLLICSENASHGKQAGMRYEEKLHLLQGRGAASPAGCCPVPTVFVCLLLALLLADALQQLWRRKFARLVTKFGECLLQCLRLLLCAVSGLSRVRGVRTRSVTRAAAVEEEDEEGENHQGRRQQASGTTEGLTLEGGERIDQARGRRSEEGEEKADEEQEKSKRQEEREEKQEDIRGEEQDYREAAAHATASRGRRGGGVDAQVKKGRHVEAEQQQVSSSSATTAATGFRGTSEPLEPQKKSNEVGAADGRGGGQGAAETTRSAAALRKEIAALLQTKAEANSSLSSDFVFHTRLQRKIIRLQQQLEALEGEKKRDADSSNERGEDAEGGRAPAANVAGFFEKIARQCMRKVAGMLGSAALKALFCYTFVRALQMLYLREELSYKTKEDAEAWLLLPGRFFWPLTNDLISDGVLLPLSRDGTSRLNILRYVRSFLYMLASALHTVYPY